MVTIYGMNKEIGQCFFYDMQNEYGFSKPYSEELASRIDKEVKSSSISEYERAKKLLKDKHKELELLAQELLKKEVLFKSDLEELIGPRPFEEKKELSDNGKMKDSDDIPLDKDAGKPASKESEEQQESKSQQS